MIRATARRKTKRSPAPNLEHLEARDVPSGLVAAATPVAATAVPPHVEQGHLHRAEPPGGRPSGIIAILIGL